MSHLLVTRHRYQLASCILATAGPIPASWASSPMLANLQYLWLYNNELTGSLPKAWATAAAQLVDLRIGKSNVGGAMD